MLVILHSHDYGTRVLELKSAIHGEVSGTQLSFIIASFQMIPGLDLLFSKV